MNKQTSIYILAELVILLHDGMYSSRAHEDAFDAFFISTRQCIPQQGERHHHLTHCRCLQTEEAGQQVIACGFVPKALTLLQQSPGKAIEALIVKVLTNITTSDDGARELLSTEKQNSETWLVFSFDDHTLHNAIFPCGLWCMHNFQELQPR